MTSGRHASDEKLEAETAWERGLLRSWRYQAAVYELLACEREVGVGTYFGSKDRRFIGH